MQQHLDLGLNHAVFGVGSGPLKLSRELTISGLGNFRSKMKHKQNSIRVLHHQIRDNADRLECRLEVKYLRSPIPHRKSAFFGHS